MERAGADGHAMIHPLMAMTNQRIHVARGDTQPTLDQRIIGIDKASRRA